MTTLGEILGQLQDREEIYGLLLESGNASLVATLDEKARTTADDPCGVALKAVHAFTNRADEEAWVKLMGCIRNSQSPAGACLGEMIAWSMSH
jgi:hypothetical protein